MYVASSDTVNWCIVAWCTLNIRRDGSSLTWHQPCNKQTALYISAPLQWMFKTPCNTLQSLIQNRSNKRYSEYILESRVFSMLCMTALYKGNQQTKFTYTKTFFTVHLLLGLFVKMCVHIYIYIYRERERERERD